MKQSFLTIAAFISLLAVSTAVPGLACITAIELNDKVLITRLTTVYDSRMIDDKQFAELAAIATSN